MRKSLLELRSDFNHTGFDFLMIDLDTGLVFTDRAFQSKGIPRAKQRNVTNARKAYDTVIRLRKKLELSSEQQGAFERKRVSLKNALEQLGERF